MRALATGVSVLAASCGRLAFDPVAEGNADALGDANASCSARPGVLFLYVDDIVTGTAPIGCT
jgi:hypothetical protein